MSSLFMLSVYTTLSGCLFSRMTGPNVKVLGDIARARNMSQLARDTGLTREGLYKAFSGQGNPTVTRVAKALDLRLSMQPVNFVY